jgi:hypothetical protein
MKFMQITKAVCNLISLGQQYIFHACQHIVGCSMTSVASFKEVFECLQAVKQFMPFKAVFGRTSVM